MKNQSDDQNDKIQSNDQQTQFAYLVAGLGIGALLGIFLAPQSGADIRAWIATKCLNGIDRANENVRQKRVRVRDLVDQGQQKVSKAVDSGREMLGNAKDAVS
jgi:gas vesicle protein